jgi:hypothetical protein
VLGTDVAWRRCAMAFKPTAEGMKEAVSAFLETDEGRKEA